MKRILNSKMYIQIRLLLIKNGQKRANYLRKKKVFKYIGENVVWRPILIPSDPELVSIGNNVEVAANVRLITHDMLHRLINNLDNNEPEIPIYKRGIAVGDNVLIGANTTIMYGVEISSNTVIAAGSVVTKTFESGSVIGGNPAKVIGNFNELTQKRQKIGRNELISSKK